MFRNSASHQLGLEPDTLLTHAHAVRYLGWLGKVRTESFPVLIILPCATFGSFLSYIYLVTAVVSWADQQKAAHNAQGGKGGMGRSAAALAAALLIAGGLLSAQQAQAGMQDIDRQCKKVLAFFALQTSTINGALN